MEKNLGVALGAAPGDPLHAVPALHMSEKVADSQQEDK
jgi:hypothetical protein